MVTDEPARGVFAHSIEPALASLARSAWKPCLPQLEWGAVDGFAEMEEKARVFDSLPKPEREKGVSPRNFHP